MTNEKPPLGIIPEKIHNYERFNSLISVMFKYSESNKVIPKEYIGELFYLYNRIYGE